jgi:hypothetical protein
MLFDFITRTKFCVRNCITLSDKIITNITVFVYVFVLHYSAFGKSLCT